MARRLDELDAVVIDADQLAREVVEPGTAGLEAVITEFGSGVVSADGTLDRAELGRIVFGNAERRAALNAITHPLIRQRRAALVADAPADAVVVEDIPLLVESDLAAAYPLVIVVHAAEADRVGRLAARGMDAADARSRIQAQADDDARRAAADVWLDNSGPVENVVANVEALWTKRLLPFEENHRLRRGAARPAQPVIVDADPTWGEQAARVIARIRHAVGERARRIDHIGSTSVPGLPAKDVIDLQVIADDLDAAGRIADDVHEAGLVRMPRRWFDVWRDGSEIGKVLACNADPGRAVNLHIRPADSPVWRDVLLLRDWLRATPDGVAEYASIKRRLAEGTYDVINDYAVEKTPWVNGALVRADAWATETGWSVDMANGW